MADDYKEDRALFTSPHHTYTEEGAPTRHEDEYADEDEINEEEDPRPLTPPGHTQLRNLKDIANGGTDDGRDREKGRTSSTDEHYAIPPFDEMLGSVHEKAMACAGFGRLQWFMFIILGLGLMGDSIELMMIAYIIPGAEKDLCMDEPMKGWLGAIAFAGMMLGAVVWGYLSDKIGRKSTLITSLCVNATFALIGAFVPTYWLFLICRFFSGVGIGGSIPIVMAYYGEFCSKQGRGWKLGLLLMFWVFGGVYASAMGWIIIPNRDLQFSLSDSHTIHSWRVFILVCIIPILLSILGLLGLPESPRFLLQVGRDLEALAIYRKIYLYNHSEAGAEYEMPEIELPSRTPARPEENGQVTTGTLEAVAKALESFWNSFFQLFFTPLTMTTFILCATWFSTAFGYYGLSIWFPEYIKKLEQEAYFRQTQRTENATLSNVGFHGLLDNTFFFNTAFTNVTFQNIELRHVTFDDCLLTDCRFFNVSSKKTYFFRSNLTRVLFNRTDFHAYKFRGTQFIDTDFTDDDTDLGECQIDFDISYSSSQVFLENFLSQLVVVPATLISALLMDKFGRVPLLVGCLFVASVSVFFIWFTDTEIAVVCINAVFNCFINGAFNSIDVATMELYPTHLRTTAFGFLSCLGRIAAILGNVAFGNFIAVSKAIPILLTSAILAVGGLISLKLPESKHKVL